MPTTDAGSTLTVGQTVHATTGTWTNSPTSYSYQWQNSANGTTWTTASGSGATTSSYTVATSDLNDYLRVTVTATNAGGSASASSSATGAVLPAAPAGGVPTITGTAQVGKVLTANHGTWTNSPTSYSYQWQNSTNGTTWTKASGSRGDDFFLHGCHFRPQRLPARHRHGDECRRFGQRELQRHRCYPPGRTRHHAADGLRHQPGQRQQGQSQLDRRHHGQRDRQSDGEQGRVLRQQRAQVHRHGRVLQLRLGRTQREGGEVHADRQSV